MPTIAISVGYATGLVVNYVLHAHYTFSTRSASATRALRFLGVVAVNYLLTLFFIWLIHNRLGLPLLVGKVVSLPLVATNSFLMLKLWVFRSDTPSEAVY